MLFPMPFQWTKTPKTRRTLKRGEMISQLMLQVNTYLFFYFVSRYNNQPEHFIALSCFSFFYCRSMCIFWNTPRRTWGQIRWWYKENYGCEIWNARERRKKLRSKDRDDVGPDSTATSNKIEEERDCLPSQTPTLNGHDYLCSGPEATAEDMLEAAQQRIRELEAALEKTSLSARFQLKPHNLIRFYTGFPPYQVLITTFFLRLTAEKMYSWSQIDIQTDNGKGL